MGTIEGPTIGEVDPLGPDQAISALYAAHWRGLVRDQQVAEDVAQEAFVATYRRWGSLRSPDAALGYLRIATVNGSRSALRKRGVRERYAAAQGAAPDLTRHVESAEALAVGASQRAEVLALLGSLPLRQREVLVLRYYLDLSESDIASALGVSRGAVKSHASRGLATLRARLAAAGPDLRDDIFSTEDQP